MESQEGEGLRFCKEFPTFDAFKATVREISVRQDWEILIRGSDKRRVDIGCRSSVDCPFQTDLRESLGHSPDKCTNVI